MFTGLIISYSYFLNNIHNLFAQNNKYYSPLLTIDG